MSASKKGSGGRHAEPEHLDVLVVGAGLSGVCAGHYLKTKCPWASFAIFEARDAIGGTWDLFRYPGVRSDSDMHTLGYSFRPWEEGTNIADGHSILQYVRETAAESKITEAIRFHHRVTSAQWSSESSCWHVEALRTDTGDTVEVTCDFLFCCSGYYRYDHGYMPEFPGMDRFRGQIVHPQAWPEDLDYRDKEVVVIGSGATAVTLVPALAPDAAHVTMLQRSPTYIASIPSDDRIGRLLRHLLPRGVAASATRWFNALFSQGFYVLSRKRPETVKRLLLSMAARQLPQGYDIAKHFTPYYNPWDQRLCIVPNGDLFRAIRQGKVSVVTDHIETFTETGIDLKSGGSLRADIVVTATGLELLFIGGMTLSVDGEEVDLPSRLVYKGMMLEGVPNFAMAVGYTNASWTLKCELTCDTVVRLLNRMHETGSTSCKPVNHDPDVRPESLLTLSSGYIMRSADRFPKQGSTFPWRVHQSYLRDYLAMKLRPVDDVGLEFSSSQRKRELSGLGADRKVPVGQ